ncbi:Molybdopterin molybdenumtransferase (EC / Periplasmic molybdate-binding domain [Olavius sp. associated proteobacterium Delta 1]|nr:Molybdopterin molybdenumtransferase (EC / Periplasmic molybdate-binding domain [Olavius sp. associated proteobacterium Delta 1]
MSKTRNVYLKMKTLQEARKIVDAQFSVDETLVAEEARVPHAVGRVLAEPIYAKTSAPHFNAAAMDGLAVKAQNTFGASEAVTKELAIGQEAFYVNTGHVMPPETDAVIMIEHVNVIDDDRIEIDKPVFPWQNVRKVGEDIVATELLFPQNHMITPYCVGALLTGGMFKVPVKKKPKILIIPTGSELFDWRSQSLDSVKPGQVLETNSFMLGSLVEKIGGTYTRHEMLADDPEIIKQVVDEAVNQDYQMILVLGGSSAGSEDYAKGVILDLGTVLVHGVTIMPGKPVVIGNVRGKPVFGMPGYPVSAIIAFEQLVRPILKRMLGQPDPPVQIIDVEPTRKIASKLGVEEFLRVKLGQVGNRVVATPLPRGAGCITSITEADGIIRIPNHIEGIKDNETAAAELLRPLSSVRQTIVVVGSHDNTLDVLADRIKVKHSHLSISSSHVGSMGGLMAVKRGACHLAGSHLLDTEDGSYNVSYIAKYLPEIEVKLVNLVYRDQGLIVGRGNPKGIRGIEDLARKDISFINRQPGSGTRILLDYRLNQIGINSEDMIGYQHEEFTHMAVAVAVLSGTVDAGLGIYAAAKALDLDFIPVVTEQYDLIIPLAHFESENIQLMLETINSPEFKRRVEELGGYSTEKTGEIIF